MVSSSFRLGWGIFSLLSVGCFVDSVGQPPPAGGSPSDGGGGSTGNFTGGAGTGGAPMGGEGGMPQGGEGGAAPPNCGDGTAVTGEQCEDGNLDAGDGCSATCQFELTCGNSVIEPTEECDPEGPKCTADCKAAAGSGCADAVAHTDFDADETVESDALDNPFPIATSAGEWGPIELCNPGTDGAIPTNVYRIQIGPYPEGVYIKVHKNGNLDPVLGLYKGCGDEPGAALFCHHANDAFVVSDVVPAGSVMFATVGDRGDGDNFDMFMWFHRFWATFENLDGFSVDPTSWTTLGLSETVVGGITDVDGAALVSPSIFVGNLDTFEVVAHYGFDDAELMVAVSFDDGVTWEQEAALANGGYDATKWDRQAFDNKLSSQQARVRVSYISTDPLARARVLALRVQPVAPFNTW